ncbi:type II toxin-antitoxin system Phd/YefM family antitoxin [Occultella aeris]|uniref:Antitoxin n=1 Tax=Occultella aeris TaxID=2761496 RepID=A0A7M4DPP0_9MICO|nr:type II toxin-antitoxin system Phd/YefM family antitoxin [Occultella aeris]VZO39434.1 Phd_YefM [Occultella aeris]
MSTPAAVPHVVSATEAATRGVPRLVRAAEQGQDVVVERHGKPVAAMISMQHLNEIQRLERDLQESVLLLDRLVTDDGTRTELGEAINALGFDRSDLEAELDADVAAGRD